MSDGTRLAAEVWLPTDRLAAGDNVGTVIRSTRYHRAVESAGAGSDAAEAEGRMFLEAGLALVVVDARGTGASFGSRTGELGEREISDFDELISWAADRPWSNGRVGVYGTSYEGQAAELVARHQNPHLAAVAALFSPNDPYRQLFYPGGVATSGRFARWMCESQVKDGVAGARERLSRILGQPVEAIDLPAPVKPVDGPEGRSLLSAAIADHQSNADVHALMDRVPSRDDRVDGLDWTMTAPADSYDAIAAAGVPMFVRVGWIDGAFAAGALHRFADLPNPQTVEIGPWGHGGRTQTDPLRPMARSEFADIEGQNRRLMDFFAMHLGAEGAPTPTGRSTLTFTAFGADAPTTVTAWPPARLEVSRLYLDVPGRLTTVAPRPTSVRHRIDDTVSSGATNRWLAGELGQAAWYPDRSAADERLLTFTSEPQPDDLHVLGFPVVALDLATNGTDGAVFVYLEDVSPSGEVAYLTEGSLRLIHRATSGVPNPGLGVPRSFARSAQLPVEPGVVMQVIVELLPLSARVGSGHRLRVAIGGHDASCFTRYGEPEEALTLEFGAGAYLDLPVTASA